MESGEVEKYLDEIEGKLPDTLQTTYFQILKGMQENGKPGE